MKSVYLCTMTTTCAQWKSRVWASFTAVRRFSSSYNSYRIIHTHTLQCNIIIITPDIYPNESIFEKRKKTVHIRLRCVHHIIIIIYTFATMDDDNGYVQLDVFETYIVRTIKVDEVSCVVPCALINSSRDKSSRLHCSTHTHTHVRTYERVHNNDMIYIYIYII
jgi:hypothetical protein